MTTESMESTATAEARIEELQRLTRRLIVLAVAFSVIAAVFAAVFFAAPDANLFLLQVVAVGMAAAVLRTAAVRERVLAAVSADA